MTFNCVLTKWLRLRQIWRISMVMTVFSLVTLSLHAQGPSVEWTTAFIKEQFEKGLSDKGEMEKGVDLTVSAEGLIHIEVHGERANGFTWGERYFPSQFHFNADERSPDKPL